MLKHRLELCGCSLLRFCDHDRTMRVSSPSNMAGDPSTIIRAAVDSTRAFSVRNFQVQAAVLDSVSNPSLFALGRGRRYQYLICVFATSRVPLLMYILSVPFPALLRLCGIPLLLSERPVPLVIVGVKFGSDVAVNTKGGKASQEAEVNKEAPHSSAYPMGNSISSPSDSHSHPSRRMNAQASSAPQPVMLPVAWIMKRTSPVPLQTLSHACACKQYTNISECQSTAANTKILNAVLRAAHTRRNEPSGRTLITKDATRYFYSFSTSLFHHQQPRLAQAVPLALGLVTILERQRVLLSSMLMRAVVASIRRPWYLATPEARADNTMDNGYQTSSSAPIDPTI
ncbi:hypothetical protein F5J12DRAFT_783614 [Pisolithus orientalis]|uniref:uncharacterized protein n=1 Tax=Pisolithus orientalis TaxID=936130 RepID=UPI00222492B7|nr:uncharacterized protein F5J12DRAFT_783614 [Pisolithus orientalis]KAI6003168.1 hypothetical protein F5J12DRAFT_783614 [Pisolithus orientalis]